MSTTSSVSGDSKRVVVFGASGRVGSRVVEQVLSRGHEGVAVLRSPGKPARPADDTRFIRAAPAISD